MINHIVLFKLKDASQKSVEKAREVLVGMRGKIPLLRHLEVGMDVLHSERSFDIALMTRFDSMEDLKAYQIHPIHLEVAKYINSVKEASIAVDYES
jgi:hypothetical protein